MMKCRFINLVRLTMLAVAGVAGCVRSESSPPQFRLDMTQVIANILDAMFGTPDKPYVLPETGLDLRKLKLAAGPVWSEQGGGKHGLYRRNCAHCHGISGDGEGPTASLLNPYPRDYRPAIYKFKSTYNPNQPTDEDL